MIHLLTDELWFPEAVEADEDGLLAIGGDLSAERLQLAYNSGIFPWYSARQPILWWSPDPRMVLFPEEFKVSKSLRKLLMKMEFTITEDQAFEEVIRQCAEIPRPGQAGTWITEEMVQGYMDLHKKGVAHSVEIWEEEELVGGLYGIDLPGRNVYCGESMFSKVSNASKVALCHLVKALRQKAYRIIDCQVYTDHLAQFGAREIPRAEFLRILESE